MLVMTAIGIIWFVIWINQGSEKPSVTNRLSERLTVGDHAFDFEYREIKGTWEIYATSYPTNCRSKNPPDCHVYSDGRISVTSGKEPLTIDRARAIAKVWAVGYGNYQTTGTFSNNGGQVTV